MGRKSKRAEKIRQASEFDLARIAALLRPPRETSSIHSWSLEAIRNARDDQMRGSFWWPARLAEAFRTDDALFTAYDNRLDPQRNLGVELVPANKSAPAARVAVEAEALFGVDGIGVRRATLATINGCLANHGLAVGYNVATPREDGSRLDFDHRYWPIEWVRWDPTLRCLVTQVEHDDAAAIEAGAYPDHPFGGAQVPIVHGDGRWVVYQKHEHEPWKQEACLLPSALVWAARGYALRDWAKNSSAHGNAKLVGKLPEGLSLTDANGVPTPEAAAFLAMLQALMSGDALVGLAPFGSETEWVANAGTIWQIFTELVTNRDRAAARIYLGTDGTLGSPGGAPGVDVKALFGVATTKVQGDLQAIERAILTGVIEPWAAVNFGDSKLAPKRRFMMPDADAEAERGHLAKREEAFHAEIKRLRENGFTVDQPTVDRVALAFNVPAPLLPLEAKRAPSIALAPTDLAVAVRVNEARASAGLGPLTLPDGSPDPDGLLPLAAYKAKVESTAQPAAPAPKPNGASASAAS